MSTDHPETCVCDGAGWVWAHELPNPPEDCWFDDTRYPCPYEEEDE